MELDSFVLVSILTVSKKKNIFQPTTLWFINWFLFQRNACAQYKIMPLNLTSPILMYSSVQWKRHNKKKLVYVINVKTQIIIKPCFVW